MPELPEVETVKRGLRPLILNKKIVQVRVAEPKCFLGEVTEVEGAKVVGLRRRGKALLIDLDNGRTVMVHLRMTGQLIWRKGDLLDGRVSPEIELVGAGETRAVGEQAQAADVVGARVAEVLRAEQFAAGHPSKNFTAALPNKQTRVTLVFGDGAVFFNDQRKFGFMKVLPTEAVEREKFIAELGKEPWEMTTEELYAGCQRHGRAPIKAVLLDQKVIAGLGNIYADETLFYAKVHPETRAGNLTRAEVEQILAGARATMQAAIDSGGSTMATYVRPDGTTGDYLEKFAQVFRREGKACPRCGAEIVKLRVAGRGTHICPKCQVRAGLAAGCGGLRAKGGAQGSLRGVKGVEGGEKMGAEGAERA